MARKTVVNDKINSFDKDWENTTERQSGESIEMFIRNNLRMQGFLNVDLLRDYLTKKYTEQGLDTAAIKEKLPTSFNLETAIAAVVDADVLTDDNKIGLVVTWYNASGTKWYTYRYNSNNITNFGNKDNWVSFSAGGGGSASTITRVRFSDGQSNTINVNKKDVKIKLFYESKADYGSGYEDLEDTGTLLIESKLESASTWTVRYRMTINANTDTAVDVSEWVVEGNQTFRFRVTSDSSDTETSPITATVVYNNYYLIYSGNVESPYSGNTATLPLKIGGTGAKTLKISINNYVTSLNPGTSPYIENTFSAVIDTTATGHNLKHGVYTAKTWLEYGTNYSTDPITFDIMFAEAGNTTPIVALLNPLSKVSNWDNITFFQFAIYNPSSTSTKMHIQLKDASTLSTYNETVDSYENYKLYTYSIPLAINSNTNPISAQFYFVDDNNINLRNSIDVSIDNSVNFGYTDGATLVIDPSKKHIIDVDGKEVNYTTSGVEATDSVWKSDNENISVLRLLSGQKIHIPYEVFDGNTGSVSGNTEGSTTIEFDVNVKNILDENVPVINMSKNYTDGKPIGLVCYPTRMLCMHSGYRLDTFCDVNYREEVRTHISVNILRGMTATGFSNSVNLVRIFVNGNMNREFEYNPEVDKFALQQDNGYSNDGINLGCDGADIDIYGMRIYKGVQLSSLNCRNDYRASMSNINDKLTFNNNNDITSADGISIDYEKARVKYNTILYTIPAGGHYPQFLNGGKQKNVQIYINIKRNFDGVADTKHSGTFVGMSSKGQGTSSKNYYWWNIQSEFEDPKEITSDEYDVNNPLHFTESGKYYKLVSYFNSDDGKSYVNTSSYQLADTVPVATKLVGKDNFASSPQSHKAGITYMFNDLWKRVVGTEGINGDRTVTELPFLCFYKIEGDDNLGQPTFCGFQTFGAGKGDKKTFGYDKKKTPDFVMLEGSDNDSPLTLFQLPFNLDSGIDGVKYVAGEEAFGFAQDSAGTMKNSFDFDMGSKTDDTGMPTEISRSDDFLSQFVTADKYDTYRTGGSLWTVKHKFAAASNFAFSLSIFLKPFEGNYTAFKAAKNLKTAYQYWLTVAETIDGVTYPQYMVFRYCYTSNSWVPAEVIPDHIPTSEEYNSLEPTDITWKNDTLLVQLQSALDALGINISNYSTFEERNKKFIEARKYMFSHYNSEGALEGIATVFFDTNDVTFHQAFNKLTAGTDNRGKNTYMYIRGIRFEGTAKAVIDFRIRFDQDDVDTVLPTDNQGQNTKPYYILEHDKNDNGINYWNAENNVLLSLVDEALENEVRSKLNSIFTAMTSAEGSVMKYFEKHYFWISSYLPCVAYNETARVLYERAYFYMKSGQATFAVNPLSQSLGNQFECEKAWLEKRLVMLYGLAEYGDFETSNSVNGAITFRSKADTYDITFTAYQYIYPKLLQGTTPIYGKDKNGTIHTSPYRISKGETVTFSFTARDSNTIIAICGMNYCSSLGDFSKVPAGSSENAMLITGKRLTAFNGGSENTYDNDATFKFTPATISFTGCPNIKIINLKNVSTLKSIAMTVNDESTNNNFNRLTDIELSGSGVASVSVPYTPLLATLTLPGTLTTLSLTKQPILSKLTMDSAINLRNLKIQNSILNTKDIVNFVYNAQKELTSGGIAKRTSESVDEGLILDLVSWTGANANILSWMAEKNASIEGTIGLADDTTGDMTYIQKRAICAIYGDIDDKNNKLYVTYHDVITVTTNPASFLASVGSTSIITAYSTKKDAKLTSYVNRTTFLELQNDKVTAVENYVLKLTQTAKCLQSIAAGSGEIPVVVSVKDDNNIKSDAIVTLRPETPVTAIAVTGNNEIGKTSGTIGYQYVVKLTPSETTDVYTIGWSFADYDTSLLKIVAETVDGVETFSLVGVSDGKIYCELTKLGEGLTNYLKVYNLLDVEAENNFSIVASYITNNTELSNSLSVTLHDKPVALSARDDDNGKSSYNPAAMAVMYAAGLAADKNIMTLAEAAAVTNATFPSFKNNTSITSFTQFDDFTKVTAIADECFSGCTNLVTLNTGKHVSTLGANSFAGCSKLKNFTIGASLTTINETAFANSNMLIFAIDAANATYVKDANGILFTKYNRILIYAPRSLSGNITLDTTSQCVLLSYAFSNCSNIETLLIKTPVTKIGEHCFDGCSNMKKYILNIGTMPALADVNAFNGDSGCKVYIGLAETADDDNTLLADYKADSVWGGVNDSTGTWRLATYRSINAPFIDLSLSCYTNITENTTIFCNINPTDCTDEFTLNWNLVAPANTDKREYRINSTGNTLQCRAAGTTDAYQTLCSITTSTVITSDVNGKKASKNIIKLGSLYLADENVIINVSTGSEIADTKSAQKTVVLYQQYAVQSFNKEYHNYNPAVMIILNDAGKVTSTNIVTNSDGSKGMYITKDEANNINCTTTQYFINKNTVTDSKSIVCESYTDSKADITKTYDFTYFDEFKYFTASILNPNQGYNNCWGFYGCSKLKHISFSNKMKGQPLGCTNVRYSVTGIFQNCSSINFTVSDLDGFTQICLSTFANCTSLTLNEIPESITQLYVADGIGDYGGSVSPFYNCTGITSLIIHSNLKRSVYYYYEDAKRAWMQIDGFYGCTNLMEIHFKGTFDELLINNILQYETNIGKGYKIFLLDDNGTEYLFKGDIVINKQYNNLQFINYTYISSITFSKDVINIPQYAFYGCTALTSITAPNVTTISQYAFYGCTALTSFSNDKITSISDYVFAMCTALTIFNVPNITSVGRYSFYNCNLLENINFTKVENVGEAGFMRCTKLDENDFNLSNITSFGVGAFLDSGIGGDLVINDDCTILTSGTFGRTKITSVTISDKASLTLYTNRESRYDVNIDTSYNWNNYYFGGTFRECTLLKTVYIGSNCGFNIRLGDVTITNSMFYNCTALTTVTFGNGYGSNMPVGSTTLGYSLFIGCVKLTGIKKMFESITNLTSIPSGLLYGCTSIEKNIVVPDSVKTIGDAAFNGSSLQMLVFNKTTGLTDMGVSVISMSSGIEVPVPISVPNISQSSIGIVEVTVTDATIGIYYLTNCIVLVLHNSTDTSLYINYRSNPKFLIIDGVDFTSVYFSGIIVNDNRKILFYTKTPPTFGSDNIWGPNINIYVGDSTDQTNDAAVVAAYKAATGWSYYADYIHSLYDYVHANYTLTLLSNNTIRGTVCPLKNLTTTTVTDVYGTIEKIVALPKTGYKFVYWDYGTHCGYSTQPVTIYQAQTIKAYFDAATANDPVLTLIVNDETMGETMASGAYEYMTGVTAYAIAKEGYSFVNWTDANGNIISTNAEYFFYIENSITLKANFVKS